jgi:hypothetical protein
VGVAVTVCNGCDAGGVELLAIDEVAWCRPCFRVAYFWEAYDLDTDGDTLYDHLAAAS